MAGIFTRKPVAAIINDEQLTPEDKLDQIFALHGRDVQNGYITKADSQAAIEAALEEARKNVPKPNIKDSDEYKALAKEYADYKVKQEARGSAPYAKVKAKFFDTVYDRVDRSEGAKPVDEQLAALKHDYEEYFLPDQPNEDKKPEEKPMQNTPVYSQPQGNPQQNLTEEDKLYQQLKEHWK